MATVNLSNENDVYAGTAGDDHINAKDGDDIVSGGDGNDTLNGQKGDDTLYGDAGDDDLNGGDGNDVLLGGDGNDALKGDAGNDELWGGAGDDVMKGAAGDDLFVGGAGDDTLYSASGSDRFVYSFTRTQSTVTETFTEWLAKVNPGAVSGGEVADGTAQNVFSSNYEKWLQYLSATHGLGDVDGDGKISVTFDQKNEGGTITVEGLEGSFSDHESFSWWTSGRNPQEQVRWYSDTWQGDGGGLLVTNDNDGADTIVDFEWGVDKLDFQGLGGLSLGEFESQFVLTTGDFNGDGVADSRLTLAEDADWSLTLLGISGKSEADFHAEAIDFGA